MSVVTAEDLEGWSNFLRYDNEAILSQKISL
jgi:hypothetical protein